MRQASPPPEKTGEIRYTLTRVSKRRDPVFCSDPDWFVWLIFVQTLCTLFYWTWLDCFGWTVFFESFFRNVLSRLFFPDCFLQTGLLGVFCPDCFVRNVLSRSLWLFWLTLLIWLLSDLTVLSRLLWLNCFVLNSLCIWFRLSVLNLLSVLLWLLCLDWFFLNILTGPFFTGPFCLDWFLRHLCPI